MATDKKAVTVYMAPSLYAQVERAALEDGRSVSNWVERTMANYVGAADLRPAKVEARSDGQLHIEDAIAAAVRRGPVRSARKSRHK